MKKLLLSLLLLVATVTLVEAQIPYFGTTLSKGKTYFYQSVDFNTGPESWRTFTTASHAISDNAMLGFEAYSNDWDFNWVGLGSKFNLYKHDNFNLGGQGYIYFDSSDDWNLTAVTSAVFINGAIVGNLGYVSNTWLTTGRDGNFTSSQWLHLYYGIGKWYLYGGGTWDMNTGDIKPVVGAQYYFIPNMSVYAFAGDFDKNTRVQLGFDLTF